MAMFQAFNISASGMAAQRFRTDIISENVANATTTRTPEGGPYTRKIVTFEERDLTIFSGVLDSELKKRSAVGNGVKVSLVTEDEETEHVMEYDPSHPDADENGYVTYPNVNIVTEMTNLIDASRSYEANVTALSAAKSIAQSAISIDQA